MLTAAMAALALLPAYAAAPKGEISAEMLGRMRQSYDGKAAQNRALRNAISANAIDKIAVNPEARNGFDTHFSDKVESSGITDQQRSGRCWLFTGLNVLRSQIMGRHGVPNLKLSHAYNFFFDQLEKSNLFLQSMIDYAGRSMDDKTVDWLFRNPLNDGGQYTGIADNLMKYGVVPAEVMQESFSANNTNKLNQLLSLNLRRNGLELRRLAAEGKKPAELEKRKEQMLSEIYRMLALTIGEPPTEFTWTLRDAKGNAVSTRKYTPLEFYNEFAGNNLKDDYVMLMNDPSREYHKVYEIDLDRHVYDGRNWTYLNLPVDEIKQMAIASIKDSTMMYFSCDVGKYLDRDRGVLDVDNFDYEALMGAPLSMNKADRIRTYASASSHAMTLMAVDLDADGKPVKWMVENSWGPGPNDGHLIMTDRWFDEYMFRLVVNKKYIPEATLKLLNQKPIKLPAWDPMFAPCE